MTTEGKYYAAGTEVGGKCDKSRNGTLEAAKDKETNSLLAHPCDTLIWAQ